MITNILLRKNSKTLFILIVIFAYSNFITIGQSEEINIVLAIDTSGSTSIDDSYRYSILYGIPKFLEFAKKAHPDKIINFGLVSWDEDVDFVISPTENYATILNSLGNLSANEYEFTDLNQAFYGASNAFNKPRKYVKSSNNIIIITNPGEFIESSSFSNKEGYSIYCILINEKYITEYATHLKNITAIYDGQFYSLQGIGPDLEDALASILCDILEQVIYTSKKININQSTIKNDILNPEDNEPIYIDSVIIEGDLAINQTSIENELRFRDCIFNGSVDFSNTVFRSPVRFEKVRFEKTADFRNSEFANDARFVDVQFIDHSQFDGVSFNKIAIFFNSVFLKSTFFNGVKFRDLVQFEGISALNHSLFNVAFFGGSASFKDISIEGKSFFNGSRFFAPVVFNNITFKDQASFSNTVFNGNLEISNSLFKNIVDFNNSLMLTTLSFSNNRLEGNLNLTNASAKDILFDQIVMSEKTNIIVHKINLTNFNTHWNHINKYINYDKEAYSDIMRIYNEQYWLEDYDSCYYDDKYEHMIIEPLGTQKVKSIIAWTLCGYGKRISHILGWSISIIIISAIIFWLGEGLETTSRPSNLRRKKMTIFDAFYFSSILFVAQAPAEFRPIGRYRYLVIVEGVLGWVLLGVLIAVLIGILTR